jgi:hypothetical protein
MQHNTQLTIRGIDTRTKQRLTKIANLRGVSLNRLAVEALQQTAGTNSTELRLQGLRGTLRAFRIDDQDIRRAEAAIADMDAISKAKQERDDSRQL